MIFGGERGVSVKALVWSMPGMFEGPQGGTIARVN